VNLPNFCSSGSKGAAKQQHEVKIASSAPKKIEYLQIQLREVDANYSFAEPSSINTWIKDIHTLSQRIAHYLHHQSPL
jgi:hypothetical protein